MPSNNSREKIPGHPSADNRSVTVFTASLVFAGAAGVQHFYIYVRGVVSDGDGYRSGSQPSIGTYLDEQPVATIDGTADVHLYDIQRVEVLEGPQAAGNQCDGSSRRADAFRAMYYQPVRPNIYHSDAASHYHYKVRSKVLKRLGKTKGISIHQLNVHHYRKINGVLLSDLR